MDAMLYLQDEISQLKEGMGKQRRNYSSSLDFSASFLGLLSPLCRRSTLSALSTNPHWPREKPVPGQLSWIAALHYALM